MPSIPTTPFKLNSRLPYDIFHNPATTAEHLFAHFEKFLSAFDTNNTHHKTLSKFITHTNILEENVEEAKCSLRTLGAE
ncbi:hypothetical protein HDV00_007016, partial [Rhizophlyctis rosea]